MKKYIISCLIAVVFYNPQAPATTEEDNIFQQSTHQKTISNQDYIGGGLASLFIGFGAGHAIQGRYVESGWVFTVLDVTATASLLTGYFLARFDGGFEFPPRGVFGYYFYGMAFLVGVLRIWQTKDAWILPNNYKIGKNIELSPNLYTTNAGDSLGFGLSLKYRF